MVNEVYVLVTKLGPEGASAVDKDEYEFMPGRLVHNCGMIPGAPKPQEEPDTSRLILHIDLDCFYAQVERTTAPSIHAELSPRVVYCADERTGVPRDQPLAVQQWGGLIAINYAARRAGISRHDTAATGRQRCPELHVSSQFARRVPWFAHAMFPRSLPM